MINSKLKLKKKSVGSEISSKEELMVCRMKGYGAIFFKDCYMNNLTRWTISLKHKEISDEAFPWEFNFRCHVSEGGLGGWAFSGHET